MALSKLEPGMRVGDQAFEAIQDAIMKGELSAGRRLQIRQVADELGISVMPVREAIKRLQEIGLVEAEPYRGAVVKRFTPQELLDVYAVRRLLEVEATVLGVPRVSAADLKLLRSLLTAMAASLATEQVVEYLDQDEEFLRTIYAAAGNPVLMETVDLLWRRCRLYKIFGARRELAEGQAAQLLTHQERLVEAVVAKDAEFAGRITAESLDAATARIRMALPEEEPAEQAAANSAASNGARLAATNVQPG